MAAKLNKRTADQSRAHIQTTVLIKRLQKHTLGELDLTHSQIDCAKYLINHSIGTARQSVEHTGDDGGPILYAVERNIVDPENQSSVSDTEGTQTTH